MASPRAAETVQQWEPTMDSLKVLTMAEKLVGRLLPLVPWSSLKMVKLRDSQMVKMRDSQMEPATVSMTVEDLALQLGHEMAGWMAVLWGALFDRVLLDLNLT